MKKLLLTMLSACFLYSGISTAQSNIANYSFAKSMGSYVPLVGATTFTNTWDNAISGAIPLGGTFTFGGVAHTSCYISSNGFITFGSAPSGTNYTPLSSGTYSGAISAFGQDANNSTAAGATPAISYMNIGGASGEFVVEFKDHSNYYNRTVERLNFQIRLNLSTGAINIVYGPFTAPGNVSASGIDVQVGIRGATTTFSNNLNNLVASDVPAGTTCSWADAVTANTNARTLLFSSGNTNIVPPNGLTLTWTPPVNATLAPVRVFSAVTGITSTDATLSWTAPSGATQYNVEYRVPGTCSWTSFSGNPVLTNSVTLTGLTPSTIYQVRVQSSDGTNNAIWSHIPNSAGTGSGYAAAGTFSTAMLSCTGAPNAGTATASSGSVCSTTNFTLNLSGASTGVTGLTYQWQSSPDGSTWSNISATTASAVVSQTTTTYYQAVVTCVGSAQSATSTPVMVGMNNFMGCYCVTTPGTSNTVDIITGVTLANSLGTVFTQTSSAVSPNFVSYSNTPVDLVQGSTSNTISITYGNDGAQYGAAWIDFNRNGVYEASENIGLASSSAGANATVNYTFTVPAGASLGNTRMRVRGGADAAYTTGGACTTSSFGETEDYLVNIITPPTCYVPTALTTTNTSASGVDLTWTAPALGTPVSYIYEIRTSGAAGSGASGLATTGTVTAPSTSVSVTGLTASTAYTAYIITNCGAGDFSIWSTAKTFTTLANCPVPTGLNVSSVTATSAVSTWTAGAGETAWDVYYGMSPLTVPTASTAATATTSTNSYSLTGLTPSSPYAIYVRANCGAGNVSVWTPVATFTTPCLSPSITATTSGIRCGVGTVTLAATASMGNVNWYDVSSGGTPLITGNTFTTPVISNNTTYYVSAENIIPGSKDIGAGSQTGTGVAYNPTQGGYGGLKGQYLFTAAELRNAGIRAGNMTSLALDITSPGATLNGFAIQIGTTTFTTFATPDIQGGLTTVYPSTTFVPATGLNTFNFSTPFNWDGTSNIIVSISWSNNNTSNSSSTVKYDNTTNYASQTYRKDNETAANMFNFTGATGSGTSTFDRSMNRPKMTFNANTGCESPRTAVTASVTTPAALTVTSGTTVCTGSVYTLNITSSLSSYDSYIWSPASNLYTDAAATVLYSGGSATTLYYMSSLNSSSVYTVTANNSVDGCANTASVSMASTMPSIIASATPTTVCSGSTVNLAANTTVVAAGTMPVGGNTASTSGSGASGGSYISPFSHYFGGYKGLYIIRASELQSAGFSAGNITSMAYSVTSVGTTYTDFAISMGATTQSVVGGSFIASLPQVYGPSNVTPVVGLNTYNFTTPFNWDGVSNIAIQVCWSNNNTGGAAAEVRYGPTTFASTAYFRDDDLTSADVCSETITDGTITNRPLLILGGQVATQGAGTINWTWNPGAINSNTATVTPVNTGTSSATESYTVTALDPANTCTNSAIVTVTVNPNPVVTAMASNTLACTGSNVTLTANGATTYSWSSGGNTQTVTVSPSGNTTYTVTGASNGCSSTATVSISTIASPTVTVTATQTLLCDDGSTGSSVLTANTAATSYTWSTGDNTQTTTVTPTVTTVYTVTVNDGTCDNSATITVMVSNCTGVKEAVANGISVYPNPNNGIVNFAVNAELSGNTTVEIYDAIGKLVIKENLNKEITTINTNHLEDGVYFFKIKNNNQEIKVGKMIKH